MKIVMIAVSSINGRITQGDDSNIYKWTSVEDQKFFRQQINKAKLIVMGSGTYEAIRGKVKNEEGPADSFRSGSRTNEIRREKLRIVLTRDTSKYVNEQVEGILEFRSDTPRELFESLRNNYDELLLVGGSKVYSSFAKAGLIDEIYLTIEPKVFGEGKPLFDDEDFEINLKLDSSEKLNEQGTLLLKYKVTR